MAVFAESVDVLDQALRATEFFRNESCGKCVPCRIGSQKLVDVGTALLGRGRMSMTPGVVAAYYDEVKELSRVMSATSICGLGQVAFNPLATALEYFTKAAAPLSPNIGGGNDA